MQRVVDELMKLGPLTSSAKPDATKLEQFQTLLTQVVQPISNDEARALSTLFGPDDAFGLAWTILHITESAPGWPLEDVLGAPENEWIDRLKQRASS
jgi:hypothetical protein